MEHRQVGKVIVTETATALEVLKLRFVSWSTGAFSQGSGRSGLLNKQEGIVDFWSNLFEKESGGELLTVAGAYALRGSGLGEPIRHFPFLWQCSQINGRYLESRRCKHRIETSFG